MSNEAKFTKGDWKVNPMYSTMLQIDTDCNMPICTVEAQISAVDGFNIDPTEEESANAFLISTAPKLYEMLDSVMSEMHSLIDEVNDQRASRIDSPTLDEPDYHDQQTLHEIQLLLKEARGE